MNIKIVIGVILYLIVLFEGFFLVFNGAEFVEIGFISIIISLQLIGTMGLVFLGSRKKSSPKQKQNQINTLLWMVIIAFILNTLSIMFFTQASFDRTPQTISQNLG